MARETYIEIEKQNEQEIVWSICEASGIVIGQVSYSRIEKAYRVNGVLLEDSGEPNAESWVDLVEDQAYQ